MHISQFKKAMFGLKDCLPHLSLLQVLSYYSFDERRANFVGTKFGGGESEGGAGIHFPPTPFSARPARAVWLLPRRRRGIIQDFVQKRFALRSVIATNKDILKIWKDWIARSPRLRRGSLRKNPFVWRLNQTAGEARRELVCPAGGGSELRSNSQMEFVSNFFLSAKGGTRSQFLIPRFMAKGD